MKFRNLTKITRKMPAKAFLGAALLAACSEYPGIPPASPIPKGAEVQEAETPKEKAADEAVGEIELGGIETIDMSERLARLSEKYNVGTFAENVNALFNGMNQYAKDGVKAKKMDGLPPRTAEEALDQGGDCTDLARIVIPILKDWGVPGGALIVKFEGKEELHMVPYVELDGKKTIIDLQVKELGKTAYGSYAVVHDLTYDQSSYMYHAEMGDYYLDKKDYMKAAGSYEKAIDSYGQDSYVLYNLGICHQQMDEHDIAVGYFEAASKLNPEYRQMYQRAKFNSEAQKAMQAAESGDMEGCIKHGKAALENQKEEKYRAPLEKLVEQCKGN